MSFGWLATFRVGSWLAFRSFILEERESVERRLNTINQELQRIGEITVLYVRVENADGKTTVTEQRKGFYVSSGSSLERLVIAYVAQGGNPLDISMFLQPDRVRLERDATGRQSITDDQPSGGVVYPETTDFYTGSTDTGGFLSLNKYAPRRMGGRRDVGDGTKFISSRIRFMRQAFSQEIKYKRNRLEARILKLCDLREQLINERDSLIAQAVGGTIYAVPDRVAARFSNGYSVAQISSAIDSLFFEENKETPGRYDFDAINREVLNQIPTLFEDLPEEENTAL